MVENSIGLPYLRPKPTDDEFRAVGFTGEARNYPRGQMALVMFAAFNGVTVEQLPEAFKYFPNPSTEQAWDRVAAAAIEWMVRNAEAAMGDKT